MHKSDNMRYHGFIICCLIALFLMCVGAKLSKPFLDKQQLITVDRFNVVDENAGDLK